MPAVTRLRATGTGRVAVEVDGRRWRVLPEEVVLRAGLTSGLELERPTLRTLRRELRRYQAVGTATRALKFRPHSERGLDERLRHAGFVQRERAEAMGMLRRVGLLDDERFAARRAELLAERGAGDALIRHDLRTEGVLEETVEHAVAALEPEASRAARVAAARGGGPAAARYLARRGFEEESLEAALGADVVADRP